MRSAALRSQRRERIPKTCREFALRGATEIAAAGFTPQQNERIRAGPEPGTAADVVHGDRVEVFCDELRPRRRFDLAGFGSESDQVGSILALAQRGEDIRVALERDALRLVPVLS